MSQFRSIFLIILALVLGSIFAQAAQPTAEPDGAPAVEHEIVLRISKQLLIELTQEPIEMEMPINTTAEGYRLAGSVSGKGITGLEMVGSDDGSAEFVLTVSGEDRELAQRILAALKDLSAGSSSPAVQVAE